MLARTVSEGLRVWGTLGKGSCEPEPVAPRARSTLAELFNYDNRVACLNPSFPHLRRLYMYTIDSQTTMGDFIPRFDNRYSDHTEDLSDAIL